MIIEELEFKTNVKINKKDALLIIDLQNDFIPGGSLAVKEGDHIIEDINLVAKMFKDRKAKVVLTQDWHPQNHLSFASNHPGKNPGDEYTSEDGSIGPVLWPDHCVQETVGAEFHKDLKVDLADKIIQKGMKPNVDSYSGFQDNDRKFETGLREYLNSLKIKRIFICGLALDYCCYFTAIDGVDFGYEVYFLIDLTRGVDVPPENISNSLKNMKNKGINFINKESFK
ncbi:MAG: bifunctional nicotinamidase/pyrazinamidase [Candidatus Hodarchaeota archaeon]